MHLLKIFSGRQGIPKVLLPCAGIYGNLGRGGSQQEPVHVTSASGIAGVPPSWGASDLLPLTTAAT